MSLYASILEFLKTLNSRSLVVPSISYSEWSAIIYMLKLSFTDGSQDELAHVLDPWISTKASGDIF